MAVLVSFPILAVALMVQSAIVSRLTLLSGSADVLLLIIAAWAIQERVRTAWQWAAVAGLLAGLLSALPWPVPPAAYLLVAALGRFLARRFWQLPLLSMFFLTLVGTLLSQTLAWTVLQFAGRSLPWREAFSLVILPSALLNLLLATPVYIFVRDLAALFYPAKEE